VPQWHRRLWSLRTPIQNLVRGLRRSASLLQTPLPETNAGKLSGAAFLRHHRLSPDRYYCHHRRRQNRRYLMHFYGDVTAATL